MNRQENRFPTPKPRVELNDDEFEALEELADKSEFWGSLYTQAETYGELSEKQLAILHDAMSKRR